MIIYTFKIKTTPKLIQTFENYLNITRLVYNLAKETKEYAYSKGVKLGKYDLMAQLPALKNEFIWIKNIHSQTFQCVIERLDRGYNKFFTDLKRGVKTNKPKYAKKKDWKSVEFKQGNLKLTNPTLRFEKKWEIQLTKIRKNKNI